MDAFLSFLLNKKKRKEKPYRGALAVSCLYISYTCIFMYLHVYFICTQGPKMLSEQCCLSLCLSIILYCSKRSKSKNQSSFTDRSGGLVAPTRFNFFFFFNYYYCSTFQRSVHDWSALFVCTLKAEEGHLSVLKILCSWHL